MHSLFSLVWRNITGHTLRSVLTTLAIALGVGMVLSAVIVGQAADRAATAATQPPEAAPGLSQTASDDATGATRLVLQGGLIMVGSIMFFAAAFVMLNAFAISVTARTQELGALRALGMLRGQVAQLVLAEALLIGLAGAGLGLLLGAGLAWVTMSALGGLEPDTFSVPVWGAAASVGAGLLTALFGAWLPARRAGRVSPLVALRTSTSHAESSWYVRYGGRVGAVMLAVMLPGLVVGALLFRPAFLPALVLTLAGSLGALAAMVLLLPALVGGLAGGLRPALARWLGTAGRLAADNLARNKLRAVLTAGAFMAVFAMLIGTSSLVPMMMKGGLRGFSRMMREDLFVMPDFTTEIASGTFNLNNAFEQVAEWQIPPGALEALAPLLDSSEVQVERIAFAITPPEIATYAGGRLGLMVDIAPYLQHGGYDFFVGDSDTALDIMRQGRGVLLGLTPAGRLNVTVGDKVTIKTEQGDVAFTVAGIGGTGFMMPVFSYTDGETYFGVARPAWLGLYAQPGEAVEVIESRVQSALKPFSGALVARPSRGDELYEVFDRYISLLNALLLLAVFVAALGVVNTMVINVAERRREIALLRAVGATQRQVRRSIVVEAAALGFMAALIAIVVSLLMVGLFAAVMTPGGTPSLGIRISWELVAIAFNVGLSNLALYGTLSLALGPLAAALAAYYPAKQAAALDVVQATRDEQVALQPEKTRRPAAGPEVRHPVASGFLSWRLAWRNLKEHRLRSVLSLLAVALGVSMTVAADVISRSVMAIITRVEDVRTIGAGLFGQMDTFLGLVGVGVALAAGFMVFNAFLMSVTQRRRQVGALRTLGMTRRQVLELMLAEGLLIGGSGALVGLALSYPLAWGLLTLLKAFGGPMFSAAGQGAASAGMLLLAIGLGLGSSLLAMLAPAWQAARVSPLEALRESAPAPPPRKGWRAGQVRALLGAVLCVVLAAYLVIAPPGRWVTYPLDLILTALAILLWLLGLGLVLPEFVGLLGAFSRAPLQRWFGAAGRLMADNLARPAARTRVLLTILTLAVGLTLIVSLTGGLTFLFKELFGPAFERAANTEMFVLTTFDMTRGVAAFAEMTSMRLPSGVSEEVRRAIGAQGRVMDWNFIIVPEIAFIPDYFSYLIAPNDLAETRGLMFGFSEGDWESARPILQNGCGVFITPLVARRQHVGLYDHLPVAGKQGALDCVVAGIGAPMANGSVVSGVAPGAFEITDPFVLLAQPAPGVSLAQLEAAAQPVMDRHKLFRMDLSREISLIMQVTDQINVVFNALLLLAILAAALGVVNTTYLSITERRRELGLMRAVGATRRQVTLALVGEAALMGLAGGLLGLLAGTGLTVILATVYGGNAWGIVSLDVWAAAGRAVRPALSVGLFGVLVAPLVCAGAAWWPVRSLLRGPALHTLEPELQAVSGPAAPEPRAPLSHLGFLTFRNLSQSRARTVLSALAVALGTAVIVATSVFISGVREGWAGGENKMAWVAEFSTMAFYGVGALLLLAAGFLIYNAFAMSVAQRQKQIGLLRSLGMTRGQVLGLVLQEALVTGGMGTLAGLLAGPLLGQAILSILRGLGMAAGRGEVSWVSVLLALGMGLGITLLSALPPAQSAARLSPLVALREAEPPAKHRAQRARWRAMAGAALLAGLTLYLVIAPPGTWTGYDPPWDWILSFVLWGVWLVGLYLLTPLLLDAAIRGLRWALARLGGNMGRLAGDNLARAPGRVATTALTFGVGLMMLVGAGGEIGFMDHVLVTQVAETILHQASWKLTPYDPTTGVGQMSAFDAKAPGLDPAVVADVKRLAAGRAEVAEIWIVSVPETSAPMPGFPSLILSDPAPLARPGNFKLAEGDWDTILSQLSGDQCAAVVSPAVGAKQDAGVGEVITLTGPEGPVPCTVAGLGVGGVPPLAILGLGCKPAFVAEGKDPDALTVRPLAGADGAALETGLYVLTERYPGKLFVTRPEGELRAVLNTEEQLMLVLSGMILLGIVAAALGMINTTLMSVLERRRELGLLRAVGATRRQVTLIVVAEAAMVGLLGALLGTLAGIGMGAIFALAYGGVTFGLVDLPLWWAAGQTVGPALLNGWPGIVCAPLLAGLAAYPAANLVLRGSAVETLEPESQPRLPARRAAAGLFSRGSLPVRFAVGTAALLTLVLVGLVAVVLAHARTRLDETTADALRRMVSWNAGMIELTLPADAQTLDLPQWQSGTTFNFDADFLLRFETLMDDMTKNGVEEFLIADQDNVVLISLDSDQIGEVAPALKDSSQTTVAADTAEGRRLLRAAAPVRNEAGVTLGSVRLAINTREIQDFLARLRNMLAGIGAGIIVLGVLLSLALSAPLAAAARQLAAHAAEARRGEYTVFQAPARRGIWGRLSLRARLTVVLVLASTALVGVLEVVAVPIERTYLESTLQDSLLAGVEWIGQMTSESLGTDLNTLSADQWPDLNATVLLSQTAVLGRLGRLQELAEEAERAADLAYIALADAEGRIVFSDQLGLIGEMITVVDEPRLEAATWRNEQVWVISAPLRRGRSGELLGALQMAARLDRVNTFLDESRNLFRLSGLIAILAAALLAQGIGGAVAAPVSQLAAGTRRIAHGDLAVKFRADTHDELALLAQAYNQMVLGLQEREWLRDMFGRFVSQEVAEAIRKGQVKLEGEQRVVSVLFCDIRDFTGFSERHTPEQVLAMLNEYLPVVVEAAQRHGGTVNKFGGDSTLVIYGAPRPLQESAYQAVTTALEMRDGLARLNIRLAQRGEAPLRIGVGINTGAALAGALGPQARQEYTVIGDTVNLASRIEALNKQYPEHEILISQWTHEALGSRRAELDLVPLGQLPIRGKAETVGIWAVRGRAPARH